MVLTRRHIPSLAQASGQERCAIFDILDLLAKLPDFGEHLIVCEHGDDGTNQGGRCQCINHCHLHVISAKVTPEFLGWFTDDQLENHEIAPNPVEIVADTDMSSLGPNYLLATDYIFSTKRLEGLWAPCRGERSQYFRRLLSDRMSLGRYDWRRSMNHDYMLRLYNHFHCR